MLVVDGPSELRGIINLGQAAFRVWDVVNLEHYFSKSFCHVIEPELTCASLAVDVPGYMPSCSLPCIMAGTTRAIASP